MGSAIQRLLVWPRHAYLNISDIDSQLLYRRRADKDTTYNHVPYEYLVRGRDDLALSAPYIRIIMEGTGVEKLLDTRGREQ